MSSSLFVNLECFGGCRETLTLPPTATSPIVALSDRKSGALGSIAGLIGLQAGETVTSREVPKIARLLFISCLNTIEQIACQTS
jgi:hypothetical protein